MSDWFIRFLNLSISAGWLTLILFVLRPLLKKAPKWVYPLLWGIVGLRLAIPVRIKSVFSLVPSAETVSPEIVYRLEPQVQTGIPAINDLVNPVLAGTFSPDVTNSVNPLQILFSVMASLWIIGIVIMLLYMASSYYYLKLINRTAVRMKDNIYRTESFDSPFVLGLFHPRIYLPYNMTDGETAFVVTHERSHIRRFDHWTRFVGFLLLSLYWFNPLMWLAYSLFCKDTELACDERAISELDSAQKADYSETLLACSRPKKVLAACPLAFGEIGVRERVKNILSYRKPPFRLKIASIAVCFAAAVCFLTDPIQVPVRAAKQSYEYSPLFSHYYSVDSVVYSDGSASDGNTAERSAIFTLTSDFTLIISDPATGKYLTDGELQPFTLTKDNFDHIFKASSNWIGSSAAELRQNTESAWRMVPQDPSDLSTYVILCQKNGDAYLVCGTSDPAGRTDSLSDPSSIQTVLKLFRADLVSCTAVSEGSVWNGILAFSPNGCSISPDNPLVPVTVNGTGTLTFKTEWNTDTLFVDEFRYADNNSTRPMEEVSHRLNINADGCFELTTVQKAAGSAERLVYLIHGERGTYALQVVRPS